MSFPGDWSNERNINNEKISFGMKRISSNFGRSGHEQNHYYPPANDILRQ